MGFEVVAKRSGYTRDYKPDYLLKYTTHTSKAGRPYATIYLARAAIEEAGYAKGEHIEVAYNPDNRTVRLRKVADARVGYKLVVIGGRNRTGIMCVKFSLSGTVFPQDALSDGGVSLVDLLFHKGVTLARIPRSEFTVVDKVGAEAMADAIEAAGQEETAHDA